MYDFELHHETTASPEALWRVYTEVSGWPRWNRALASAYLDADFVTGAKGGFAPLMGVGLHFRLDKVEPLRCFDVVWGIEPLLSLRLTHTIERTATGCRFSHGFHAGGLGAPTEWGASLAERAAIPGKMALLANLAEGRSNAL